ncbi:MAG: DUF4091 domain-containing protein [Alistipes sp.]|nr:DUF4091 domain-containing protein [Alistipes sp.]MBQ8367384.1 DUF4091 domain-containing protein [Alistipes sp.]
MRHILSILTLLVLTSCATVTTPADAFTEAPDPVVLTPEEVAAWDDVREGLNAAWASTDLRYGRSVVPEVEGVESMPLVAWRGERVAAQILLWSADDVGNVRCEVGAFRSAEATLPQTIATTRFVRYTLVDGALSADMLDTIASVDIEARSVRPVWLTVAVPEDAEAGVYTSEVVVTYDGGSVALPLTLEVQRYTLATPDKWSYHLDLWQHPTAVARAEGLELWSDAHFEALRRTMMPLAKAGQKVVTATLNKDPWNHQCYDGYAPMIEWRLRSDGTWSYDYAIFDRWVELMFGLGINKMINCYSMVPWNCELEYYDEVRDEVVTVVAEPGTPIFADIWRPFLLDFKEHLRTKGWLDITNIAMDERGPEAMDAAVEVLAECAPEMGFAIADMHRSYRRYMNMRDVCVAQEQPADHGDILARRAQGYNTTFYVCCNPPFPNTFTTSQPYEAELLGWYGLASDYDGMLRWAYNSWPADPAYDSRYGTWSAGDTFLVYPHARSSVRFERLVDGIEVAEKVRTLRRMGVNTGDIDDILAKIRGANINDADAPWMEIVAEAREVLNEVSRR